MKYAYILLIFIFGFTLGRWTAPHFQAGQEISKNDLQTELPASTVRQSELPASSQEDPSKQSIGESGPANKPGEENKAFSRTDDKLKDKQMRKLFGELMEANRNDNLEEQNRLLREMEALDPKHEKVFQAKATFLEDDDDWDGAHKVLEECVATIPTSVYCLQRLANIRSSTIDDKVHYGTECLRVSPNEQFCLVDLAIALQAKGEFAKAKDLFERALSLPVKGEGYFREYILYLA